MKTALMRWMEERKLPPYRFAKQHNLPYASVYVLAGVKLGESRRQPSFFRSYTLRAVSDLTGIPVDTLEREAEEARRNPTPARKYERKAAQP